MSDVQDTTTDQQNNNPQDGGTGEAQEAQQNTTTHEEETTQHNETERDNFDVEKELKKLRKESAARRTSLRDEEKKNAELTSKYNSLNSKFEEMRGFLAKLSGAEEKATPEQLIESYKEKLEAQQQENRQLRETTALNDAVAKAKGDPALIIPYLRGSNALANLDPSAENYSAQVAELVQETVDANPKLRAQAAPVSSGNTSNPTNNSGPRKYTVEDLNDMSAQEIYELTQQGKLEHLYKK
ncbi:hypothetical protein ACKFR5_02860 [Corynebacterium marquesiae]|uniref:hypothetical protein n=1 Tax=Corynebacterium marquesiae TaxID=2913503 RepID=UPI0038D1F572